MSGALFSFLAVGLFIWTAVTLLWVLSLIIEDASIIDIYWGMGFVTLYWFAALFWYGAMPTLHTLSPRQALLGVLLTIWGLRLSIYILRRNWSKEEDYRYAKWRAQAGETWWWRSYFKVFLLQGGIMWIVSIPLQATIAIPNQQPLFWLDGFAVFVWLIGFIFEAVGDWQLARFKANLENKGKLLTTGLWRYTRHPNYFGDAVQWWGFYIIALAAGAWWTIISPMIMTFLLIRISGVAMLERKLQWSKPGYEDYMWRTNAFFPGPPKRSHRQK
jgi:steroid 5-alpha reductase family enzyme